MDSEEISEEFLRLQEELYEEGLRDLYL
jgi:hypothetical protein